MNLVGRLKEPVRITMNRILIEYISKKIPSVIVAQGNWLVSFLAASASQGNWLVSFLAASILVGLSVLVIPIGMLLFIILGPIERSHRMRFVRFILTCVLVILVGLVMVAALGKWLVSIPIGAITLLYFSLAGAGMKAAISRWYEPDAPNGQLTSIARLFSPIEIERIFEPIIADWQDEYAQAYNAGHIWTAIFINFNYRFRVAQTVGIELCNKLIGGLVSRTER
jgi:hypothetical protein